MADSLFINPALKTIYWIIESFFLKEAWKFDRSLLLAGYYIEWITNWLRTQGFGPAITLTAQTGDKLLIPVVTLAVFLLGFQYVLASWFHFNVVEWKSALAWLLGALLFYGSAPTLYTAGEMLRNGMADTFYRAVLVPETGSGPVADSLEGSVGSLSGISSGSDVPMGTLQNNFGPDISTDIGIDGLDIAMAYVLADRDDVIEAPDIVPAEFRDTYLDPAKGPATYDVKPLAERVESVTTAAQGYTRLLFGISLIVLGLLEATIHLCLAVAAGLLFISFSIALPFAFFQRTNLMARSILDAWIELLVMSAVMAVFQAFGITLVLVTAATGNPTLVQGATLLGLLVMGICLFGSIKSIFDALNRLFLAFSRVTGGRTTTPTELMGVATTVGVAAAIGAATGGAGMALLGGGVTAASHGARLSGAEGAAAGLNQMGSMAMMVARQNQRAKQAPTPPTPGTPYAHLQAAQQHLSAASRALPQANVGVPVMTAPTQVNSSPVSDMTRTYSPIAFDLSVISSAIQAALTSAPQGGYRNYGEATLAVQGALKGMNENPNLGNSAATVGSFVHNASRSGVPANTGANFFREVHTRGVSEETRAQIEISLKTSNSGVNPNLLERQAARVPVNTTSRATDK